MKFRREQARILTGAALYNAVRDAQEAGQVPGVDPETVEIAHEADCLAALTGGVVCTCRRPPKVTLIYRGKQGAERK